MWTAYTVDSRGTEISAKGETDEAAELALRHLLPNFGVGFDITVVAPGLPSRDSEVVGD